MELPINLKDLDTIVNALALGGDARLYFLLKKQCLIMPVEFRQFQTVFFLKVLADI